MVAQQVARIIAHFVVFLECTDEENLDPDAAVQIMEQLAGDMGVLDLNFRRELAAAFDVVALDYDGEARERVRHIADAYGLFDDVSEAGSPVPPADRDEIR